MVKRIITDLDNGRIVEDLIIMEGDVCQGIILRFASRNKEDRDYFDLLTIP